MKKFLILSLLASLFYSGASFGSIVGLARYVQYDQFSQNKCKNYNAKISCGARNKLIWIFAEVENKNSFLLTIQERSSEKKSFQIREYLVSFHYKDGITIVYKEDYYDQFEEEKRAKDIPIQVRYWLIRIMQSLNPTYKFIPKS